MNSPADLTQQLYSLIAAYAQRLAPNAEQAHELTQEAFLKAHRALPTLHHEEKLAAWVRRIVYNTLREHYRNRPKWQLLEELDLPAEAEEPAEGNQAVLGCLALLLQLLPPAQRSLLEAVELRGVSQTQYALDHQVPLSTIKARVQRARRKLYEQLTGQCFITNDSYGNVVNFVPPPRVA